MIIVVQAKAGDLVVALDDPDNFQQFDVRVSGLERDQAEGALKGVAEVRGDHAFVEPPGLFLLRGARSEDVEWLKRFDEMVEYARSKSWVDGHGRVRAHIIWS